MNEQIINISMNNIPEDIKQKIEAAAEKEEIYEPKYGGKDHSGYSTLMLYEVNYERSECFEKGAEYGYSLAQEQLKEKDDKIWAFENIVKYQNKEIERLNGLIEGNDH